MVTIKIYTLTNPLDGNIFYIGKTYDMKIRLSGHLSYSKKGRNKKDVIIQNILSNGKTPIIEEIDRVDCLYKEDEDYCFELESYWMQQLYSWGFNIVNHAGFKTNTVINRQLSKNLEVSIFERLLKFKTDKLEWFKKTIQEIKDASNLTFEQKTELVNGFLEEREKWLARFRELILSAP